MRKRRITNKRAEKYYKMLRAKVRRSGCTVEEVDIVDDDDLCYGLYHPNEYLIELKNSKSSFVMLVVLAHEYGHYKECMDIYNDYGMKEYYRRIYNSRKERIEDIMSEAKAWIVAESELNKIDPNICRDYRFHRHRKEIFETVIYDFYGDEKNGILRQGKGQDTKRV